MEHLVLSMQILRVKYSCGCLLTECITHLSRYIQLKVILQSRLNVMSSSLLLLFSLNIVLTMFPNRVFLLTFRDSWQGQKWYYIPFSLAQVKYEKGKVLNIKAYCLNI